MRPDRTLTLLRERLRQVISEDGAKEFITFVVAV